MRRLLPLLLLVACGMRRVEMPPPSLVRPTAAQFATVEVGMDEAHLQIALGHPDALYTGFNWWGYLAPFYVGPDAWREVYHYRGLGRVTLRYGVFTGGWVMAVEPDADEAGQ